MDAQQFGAFIQQRRKELGMKQSDLAEKLHVTDKAVSRWERAVGFPDIKLLEPLAEALQISLTELLQCRLLPKEELPGLRQQTEKLLQEQTKLSWKRKIVLWLGYAAIWAAGLILIRVSHNTALDPLLQKLVFGIALVGGALGCRALEFTVGRLYLKKYPWGIWHNRHMRAVFILGLAAILLIVNWWIIPTPAPLWNTMLLVLGFVLGIAALLYYAKYEDEIREAEAHIND